MSNHTTLRQRTNWSLESCSPAPVCGRLRGKSLGLTLSVLAAIVVGMPLSAVAQLTINLGSMTLPTGAAVSDPFVVEVTNAGAPISVKGLDFFIQVEELGPKIESVDLLTGTIFETNHDTPVQGSVGSGDPERFQFWSVAWDDTQVPPVLSSPGPETVATLRFDTTGVAPGVYDIKVGNIAVGITETVSTQYADTAVVPNAIPINIVNGTLTVVPEPSASLAVAGLLLGVAVFLRRWRVAK